ncbi:nicotinate (nicotinamide) nucleotide adenylyltransferase [Clostridium perfringens]|uniref:Probable nicotinate-nucleotide adenylyltransferase n=1 Tax=Clostridium perfringens TaxID=1502 RepID=A0A140GRB4_CLOPF|nr:nicotinate (nicotinamide) nucleotide adenylyltransferase [Clostridium perfringens]AMN31073.1 putative nicotinate-nucleotide adenylyltransferase [Clostridium perfringens]TBX14411.1 nicotinate (nicotinamide) nucleotide adenylyltransferase [Clostridium perfringens]
MIVVFGGSFNPPSIAHIDILKEIYYKKDGISKIIIVPVANEYEKKGLIEFKHRYNMLKIATNKYNFIEICDIEYRQKHSMKTYEVLDYIQKKYSNEKICFILGADNFNYFSKWVNSEYILRNYKLLVVNRGDYNIENIIKTDDLLQKYRLNIISVELGDKFKNISSTFIRKNINNIDCLKSYIDMRVLEYIYNNNLYKVDY